MYFLKELFINDNYKIAIVEAKDFLLKRFELTDEVIINQRIDTRIMTCIVKVDESIVISSDFKEIPNFDYMIYVYDFDKLNEDNSFNQAIILHELAHIYYPPDSLQQELECDIYAVKEAGSQAVYDYLNISIQEMKKMGKSTRDLEIRKITIESLLKF